MEAKQLICEKCGFQRTAPWPRRIPSFWSPDFGFSVEEYIHACIETRARMFDPRGHRNQGYKGTGKCLKVDCEVCRQMRMHGV